MASKSSEVRIYFMNKPNDLAQCLLCKKDYSRKGRRTTSLKDHLKSVHKEQFEELIAEERKKSEKLKKEKNSFAQSKDMLSREMLLSIFRVQNCGMPLTLR